MIPRNIVQLVSEVKEYLKISLQRKVSDEEEKNTTSYSNLLLRI